MKPILLFPSTLIALISIAFAGIAFGQAKKAIRSLEDIEVLKSAAGDWEGVGVSFDIKDGELQQPLTFTDDWGAGFRKGGKEFEMTGMVRQAGKELPYSWVFKLNGGRESLTATYEMASEEAGELSVKLIADGKRVQLKPIPGKRGIHMEIDIYFEGDDMVIEALLKNVKGETVYRSAGRYQSVAD